MLLEQQINSIDIRYVVLLDADSAGDLYMEKLFPMWPDVVVVTLDGKYPENPILRVRVLAELKTNTALYCLVYGAGVLEKLEVVTQRVLHMVDFLTGDLIVFPWQTPKFDLNDDRIIAIMKAFSNANDITPGNARINTYNALEDYLATGQEHQRNSIKWYHQLIRS